MHSPMYIDTFFYHALQSVRTVFNLAIGSGSADMQSTAQSALLQMLNTVLKRVGQQVGVSSGMSKNNAAADLAESIIGQAQCRCL